MFTVAGPWEIRVMNFEREGGVAGTVDRPCYAPLRVFVVGQGTTSPPANAPAIVPDRAHWVVPAASLSAIALAGLAFVLLRRRLG